MSQMQVLSKNAKIHDGKNMKTISHEFHYHQKLYSDLSLNPLSNPRGDFLLPRAKKLKK